MPRQSVPPYLAWGCGGGGRASPGGCLRPLRGASGVLRSSSPDCSSTGWAVGVRVVGAGVRVWGPCSVPVGAARRGAGPWRSYAGGRAGGGGGGACAVSSGCAAGAGPVGRGVALPLSFPLPSLGRQQRRDLEGNKGVVLSMGGVAPHTTPVRAHPASLGRICAASRCAGVGPLALRGLHVSRRLRRGGGSHSGSPLGRGGPIPPASGGGGRGPRGWRAGGGAGGGGCRAAASLLSLRAAACGTPFWPSPCRRRAPFRRARAVGAEVPPRGGGGARGAARGPLPRGPQLT